MIGALKQYVVRKRFQAMVAEFDRQIEEARKRHQPIRGIVEAKRRFVNECLAGGRSAAVR